MPPSSFKFVMTLPALLLSNILAMNLASAQSAAIEDWRATLREDATAMHDAIASSHPGMVNPDDPEFALRNEAQYKLVLERAETADSFADYFYALQHYLAAFDDGHLSFGVFGATPDLEARWPGFIARYDGSKGLTVTFSEPWSGVPAGARIESCDGRSAFQIGDDRMGARFGRWELASQRYLLGAMVMIDTGDPYVRPIERCVFQTHEGKLDVALEWRDGGDDFMSRYSLFPLPDHRNIGMRRLDDGAYWIDLPTFTGDPESEGGRGLGNLIGEIAEQASSLRAAPAIVFDLRGNGGGSSQWSAQIAEILWGEGAFWRAPEPPMTVIWRASEGNLRTLRDSLAERDANGNLTPDVRDWFSESIAGLENALARGDDRWVIEPNLDAGKDVDIEALPYHPPRGKVFVLVDSICMSACLDAVDLWTRFGAVPVGRETGADTIYMDARRVVMPSGLGSMSLPMKYYVGRARGHNQSVEPVHRFNGDMNDTSALEEWIATLPR